MLTVGRTTNALFAELVTKGSLFEAIDSKSTYPTEEERSVTGLDCLSWSVKQVVCVLPVCRRLLTALEMCLDFFVEKVLDKCPAFAEKVTAVANDVAAAH